MTRFWDVMMQKGTYFLATLLGGLGTTVTVALGALIFALVFGLIVALLRVSRWRVLRGLAIAYIEFIRGTPALVQLFVIYFGLPDAGITTTPLQAAIIGLGVNGAAYLAEIYRAGIEAIHKGQMEAALTLGMTPARAMQYIILPQAVRTMLPPMTTFAITLLKDTALVSVVAAPEIMFYARNLVTESFLSMHVYLIAAIIYLSMTIPMARIAAALERSRRRWQ
jgi:His/Glu/Gln/Arg/opine family amino acid ABC transporter permease subunit